MPSLYELTQQALELQEMLMSGDMDDEVFEDTLESLDIDTKIENVCKMIRNLDADAKAYKEEKDRLAAKQKAAENGVKRLKEALTLHLRATSQKSVKAGLFKVSVGSSKSVVITDDKILPIDYFEPQPDKIMKKEIAEALKAGEEVPGACLEESYFVSIR